MNSIELIDKKEQLQIRGKAIISGAEKESRKLNDEETASFNEILKEIEQTDEELRKMNNQIIKLLKWKNFLYLKL